ncbi:ABC-type branched-subunit amino acid transport system substrate-binding protein [Pseudomonas sp. JAI111]|uniref:ABC transporter substrate-binding protein n=1 Tax=Pseudomonas sp. JAI111 TaxID=2735913 RepID=UPI00216755A3|nr:ABC transporter substrate-binding protein [Pseudomonas sp. JAI111]MCS3835673.1 ABC-type branched-subunit amino acid transport system substrate-binding protein [Pseudomonas sp. JAI111]
MTLKIGILVSEPQLPSEVWRNCAMIALEDAQRREILDYDIEFVEAEAEGLPTGDTQSVTDAWKRLADQGVVAIVGPAAADNAMAVKEMADEYKVPTISITATSYVTSEWCFSVSWGSGPEDAFRMVDWLKSQGVTSMGIIWDTMWHSGEFVEFLRIAGKRAGIRITCEERISMRIREMGTPSDLQMRQAREAISNIRASGPQALAVATALATSAVGRVLNETDWDVPVVCNTSLGIGRGPKAQGSMDGWVGTSVYDERNVVGERFLKEYEKRHGAVYHTDFQLSCHDAFRVLFEGLSLAPIMTRRGLCEGLEKIRMLPSGMGGPGTYLGFGTYDHRALKGKDAIVLRKIIPGGKWERVEGIAHASLATD